MLRFQGHPLHEEMDGADQMLHEVPFSLLVDGQVEIGIIDAMYERAGVWTIIEFKTDWVRNQAELERLLAEQEYLAQARRYIDAAQTLLGLEPRLFLCMLNYAGSVYPYQLSQVDDAPMEA
jgi:ATP-dependent exoDNAse (exonuclease V) beta subunit